MLYSLVKKITLTAGAIITVVVLLGCTSQPESANRKTIYIGPNRVDCVGVSPQQCLLVKENPGDDWGLFYDQIEGFQYEEGYEYELIVETQVIEDPPQDGSMFRNTLVEIVSKTKVEQETPGQVLEEESPDFLTWKVLENAVYPNPWSSEGTAQLVGGEYNQGTSQDAQKDLYLGLTPYRYYGDIDGDEEEDTAVIMIAAVGNTSPTTNLVMVLNRDGEAAPLVPEPLGGRVFIRSVDIHTGGVQVELDIFEHGAPACCPTKSVLIEYSLVGERLRKIGETSIPGPKVRAHLDGTPDEISFDTGEETKVVTGLLPHQGVDLYLVRGLAGQVMDVRLDSPHDDVLLSITGAEDGKILATINAELTSWSGELPSSQDYIIRAVSVGGDTPYQMRVEVMGEGGRTKLIPPEPYLIPIGDEKVEALEGPGLGYRVIGKLDSSEAIHITGKNQGVTSETRWWRVCCFNGREGWVRGDTGEVVGSTTDLPVAEKSSESTPEPIVAESPPPATTDRVVYLTFNVETRNRRPVVRILEVLAKYNARATFFVNRRISAIYPDLIPEIIQAGHTAAVQTSSSTMITRSNRNQYVLEITNTREGLGNSKTTCLRPPYEVTDSFSRAFTSEIGFDVLMWDIDSGDWKDTAADEIAKNVSDEIHSGAVVLMHIFGGEQGQFVEALEKILSELNALSYIFAATCKQ